MRAQGSAATAQQVRRQLDTIRKTLAEQDARLAAAHAQTDARALLALTPRAQEDFELLCTVPERPARTGVAPPEQWSGLRC